MTAMRAPDTAAPDTPASPAAARARRAGAARRQTTAAGQARRSLQRDLDRREAQLRISRRVSGPAGGIQRPAPPVPPQAQPPAVHAPVPVSRRTTAAPAMPEPRQAPQPRATPTRPATPGRAAAAPAAARVQTTVPRGADLRQPPVAPYGVATATAPQTPAAAAAVAQPAPAPARAPLRPFVVLPGGAPDAAPGARRLSTPAVVLTALVAIVLTVGMIVAAQIRITQMNEQIGSDLAATSQLQQSTTGLKERISALVATARIDHEAARRQLVEPDPVDVTFLRAGDRAQTAERAARALREMPLNPAGGPRPSAAAVAAAAANAAAATSAASAAANSAATPLPPNATSYAPDADQSTTAAPTTTTGTTTP